MKLNKETKRFKRLTEDERIELSNLEFFYKYNISALKGKDVTRMWTLQKHREQEDKLARQERERSLRDEAYKWF